MYSAAASHRRISLAFAFLLSLGLLSGPLREASAISIRDDTDVSLYNMLGDLYPAAGYLTSPLSGDPKSQNCSCTLVSPTKVLTAAHCVDNDGDGTVDFGYEEGLVSFGLGPNVNPQITTSGGTGPREGEFVDAEEGAGTISSGTASRPDNVAQITGPTRRIVDWAVHPEWDGDINGDELHDLAVLTLSSPIQAVTPMRLLGIDPTDQRVVMVGYGIEGLGSAFPAPNSKIEGANDRLAAENTLDFTDLVGGILDTDFDSPTEDLSTYGTSTPLPLEGTTAPGDSGGPLIIMVDDAPFVVGVLSGGYNPFGVSSEYGDLSRWTWIGSSSNAQFLVDQGIVDAADLGSDFDVDLEDITTLMQNFTGDVGLLGAMSRADGDTDGDGDVDTADIVLAFQQFTGALSIIGNNPDGGDEIDPGITLPGGGIAGGEIDPRSLASVPEPASVSLLALGSLALLVRPLVRRKAIQA